MKRLNQNAANILKRILEQLEDRYKKFDNSNGSFMPLSVEYLKECPLGKVYSMAHYYEQNGDLMADPEMTFVHSNKDGNFYPMSYRLDSLGINRLDVFFNEDGQFRYRPHAQKEDAVFMGKWLKNIKYQQGI